MAEHRTASREPDEGGGGARSHPYTFYMAAVNGGVWKTTDAGRVWKPIFDDQPTGSIGTIAVAPSDANIVYVGSGEGLHRPDLSTGDGIYKSTDAGRTWTHLGLRDAQQIPEYRRRSEESQPVVRRGPRSSHTVRTRSAASFAPPTAARRSSRCSTRTRTPAATTSTSIRSNPDDRLRDDVGRAAGAVGERGLGGHRTAASSSPSTAARRGSR